MRMKLLLWGHGILGTIICPMMSLHGIPIRGWIAAIHGRFITNCRKAVKQHCLDRLGDEGAGLRLNPLIYLT